MRARRGHTLVLLFVLLAEEEEDKGEEVGWAGWAGQMELGQALVGCTVRPGNFLLSLSLFLF